MAHTKIKCLIPGCTVVVSGSNAERAQTALNEHVYTMHMDKPDDTVAALLATPPSADPRQQTLPATEPTEPPQLRYVYEGEEELDEIAQVLDRAAGASQRIGELAGRAKKLAADRTEEMAALRDILANAGFRRVAR